MTRRSTIRAAVAVVILFAMSATGHGQATARTSDLRAQLRERYDVVALQQGVALVPRQAGGSVRMIQIVDGVVTVDGEALTGRQLRERLGRDADLVLQVSYLDAARQRQVASATPEAPGAGSTETRSPDVVERTDVQRGDVVRFGGDVTVGANERVQGDVVAMGGAVDVQGEVTGDVSAIGGSVTLGAQAVVRGDVNVIGGVLTRAPGARIFGSLNEVGPGFRIPHRRWQMSDWFGSWWSRLGSLMATVVRLLLIVLLGLVAVAFGRTPIERIAARTAAGPLRPGLIGLLAEILFGPVVVLTIVVLAVSIVGIPFLALVPVGIVLVMLVMLIGFLGLACHVGRWIAGRLGWNSRGMSAEVTMGIVAIGALTLLAKLAALAGGFLLGAPMTAAGYLIEYVAWTIGFGAALLTWYEARRGGDPRAAAVPPPLPSEA